MQPANRIQPEISKTATRSADSLMASAALGAFKPSRLSLVRIVLRTMVKERWRIETDRWDLDSEGHGTAIYRIRTPDRSLSFVVFSERVPEERRSDRVIAEHFDAQAFLSLNEPSQARIDEQRHQLHDLRLGRADAQTIGWSRANRSRECFDLVVECLADGRQPDMPAAIETGHLMHSLGFWGDGRRGTLATAGFHETEFLGRAFHAEALTLFLWRQFSIDLVEHLAVCRSPGAAGLTPEWRRYFGIGMLSDLGLVPFVVAHPKQLDSWILTREIAIGRCLSMPARPDSPEVTRLAALLDRAIAYGREGAGDREPTRQRRDEMSRGLEQLRKMIGEFRAEGTFAGQSADYPWRALADWARRELHLECQEQLHSLLIEVYPDIADYLEPNIRTAPEETSDVEAGDSIGRLRNFLQERYDWVFKLDPTDERAGRCYWYVSEDGFEHRRGTRGSERDEAFETFVDVCGEVRALAQDLEAVADKMLLSRFLFDYPWRRDIVERVQSTAGLKYGEVQADLCRSDFEPSQLIRFVMAQYGFDRTVTLSPLWVRGACLQGGPLKEEIAAGREGDWLFPLKPDTEM